MALSTTAKMASFEEKTSPKSLRTFPIELRHMIYCLLLRGTWEEPDSRRTARTFLAALRADVGLYKEALIIFYKTNTFSLSYKNYWLGKYFVQNDAVRFMDIRVVSLASTFRRIHVEVPLSTSTSGPIDGLPSTSPTFDRTARIIRMAQNLTYLHVEPTINSGCRTQWLALICDLIGPADSCPSLLTLKFTWAAYMIEKYSHTVEWTIHQFDSVFGTPGYLESPSTGHKASWIWQHLGKDAGRVLKWGNHGKSPARIEISLAEAAAMRQRDLMSHDARRIWQFLLLRSCEYGVRPKCNTSIFAMPHPGTGANRPPMEIFQHNNGDIFRQGIGDDLPNLLDETDIEDKGMWRPVSMKTLLGMKKRCEGEQERGSLIHHEPREENHLTKWLSDQGFECPIDTLAKSRTTLKWALQQEMYGNPSQRGSEGDLQYVSNLEDVDIDNNFQVTFADGLAVSLPEGEETHPTTERRVPGVKYDRRNGNKYHSALPSNWDCADSDEGMEKGEEVFLEESERNDRLARDRVYAESVGSGDTVLLEDLVFEPGKRRGEIIR
ncbi:uncharacterized protein EAE98_011516 [Botrytis deweyae]|uniref:Uncharacterized protein n=1 Tax=Botrytis deweyae TaxID=2478750 RepID=A0ABQ7I5R9_9HELO|nr:uncharacterized protein EAE98_011516 [Botrytis deweyae]KAF7913491.1 hypothetical protein EAE98_011516 [Botrytis deweyae]